MDLPFSVCGANGVGLCHPPRPTHAQWEVHVTVSPMWLDACVCVCGMLTLVAGVARGATVIRAECNWPESSHAGAQPAKFCPPPCRLCCGAAAGGAPQPGAPTATPACCKQRSRKTKKLFTLLDLCVSSLRRGHANLLCIVPTLTDDPRRESESARAPKWCGRDCHGPSVLAPAPMRRPGCRGVCVSQRRDGVAAGKCPRQLPRHRPRRPWAVSPGAGPRRPSRPVVSPAGARRASRQGACRR